MAKVYYDKDADLELIKSKTIAIIGYGRIGKQVEKILNAFGCDILRYDINQNGHIASTLNEDHKRFLINADIVTLHTDYREEYHEFFNETFFQYMHQAIFINTSRGECVDEQALLQAIKEDNVGFAALDVHQEKNKNDLIMSDKVLLTGHIGGYTRESLSSTETFIAKKVIDWIGRNRG